MFVALTRLARALGFGLAERVAPDRESSDALAGFAHEIRQPLAVLATALHMIRHAPDEASRERACRVLERQSALLARLVDDLLEANVRRRLAVTALRKQPLDLCSLVEETTEAVRLQASKKLQQLDTMLPPSPVWVEADPVRLQQVLSNLLVNAVTYTDSGGRVWVNLTCGGGEAVLSVRDTGRGIAPDFLPRVFDTFAKGDDSLGQGLGLAVSRRLVELHGGTIRASSPGPGAGSEFIVSIPAHPDPPALAASSGG
jgi:signal transduction histidine kinase